MEFLRLEFLEVLWDILIGQVAAQKHAVQQTVVARERGQSAGGFARRQHLIQALEVETRGWSADDAVAA